MIDYEEKILAQAERNDENPPDADYIEIRSFNVSRGCYETVETLYGEAARRYMEFNGIY